MSLMKLESELRKTEAEILDCYDVYTGEEIEDPAKLEERVAIINQAVAQKHDTYAKIIKDGLFKRMNAKIDDKIKALKREKDDLKFREQRIEQALHEKATKEGKPTEILGEDGKPELYITPSYSINQFVNIEEVEGSYLKSVLAPISFYDYEHILFKLEISGDPVTKSIAEKLREGMQRTCNVSDLPKGHKAIKSSIRPTVKMTIRKPKDESEKDNIPSEVHEPEWDKPAGE